MTLDITIHHDLKKLERSLNALEHQVAPKATVRTLICILSENTVNSGNYEPSRTLSNMRGKAYDGADEAFSDTMEKLLKLATNAHKAFIGSNFEEKRELLNFVFSNLQLKGLTLCYSLNFLFDRFFEMGKTGKWLPILNDIRTNPASRIRILNHKINYINSNFLYQLAA